MNFFKKLRTANLVSVLKQEVDEPQHVAVEGLSDELARLNRVSEFSGEIERVQKEIDLAIGFIDKDSDELLNSPENSVDPDAYILYHYGAFLNLVHQLKDKILHLCDGMTTTGKYKEREGKNQGLGKKITEKEEVKNLPGLASELEEWAQDKQNPIGYALSKRTTHHHTRSKLARDRGYQDYQVYKTLIASSPKDSILNEYGKKTLTERGLEGFRSWHQKVLQEMKGARDFTENSLQKISKILYENCQLHATENEFQAVLDAHHKMMDSFKITNQSTREKISPEFEELVAHMEKTIPQVLEDNFVAAYLIGSVARGEAIVGISDISIVVILKGENEQLAKELLGLVDGMNKKYSFIRMSLSMTFFLESEFQDEKNKKVRFLCKTEGVLIAGKDVLEEEEYPKPGIQLSALLNSDVRLRIQKLKAIFEEENIPQHRVDQVAREVSKITLRVFYSAVLADTAEYQRSLKEIKKLVNTKYPQNKSLTNSLYKIATDQRNVTLESLATLFEIYEDGGVGNSVISQIEEKNLGLANRKKYK